MILTRVTDARTEAVSLTEIKSHLRIDETDDNDALLLIISGVRNAVENYLERTLITSTWKAEFDAFETEMRLPMKPIKSIESLKYYDDDNIQQTLSAALYEFDETGRLRSTATNVWPSTYDRYNAIEVNYTAGDLSLGKLPEDLRLALRLLVGHFEKNRENTNFAQALTIPFDFKALLAPYRTPHV